MTNKFITKLLMSLGLALTLIASQPVQARNDYRNIQNDAWSASDIMEDDGQTRKCCKVCASEILAGRIFTKDLTVSGTSIFEGPATFNDLVTFNGDLNINGTETVENLVVTNATDFPPAPALITVNPALPEDRFAPVPNFQTIQAAINWLQNKKIVNTTINIAPGVYNEKLIIGPALSGDARKFSIVGDTRQIVGLGIAHGSFWNSQNANATTYTTVGGAPAGAGEADFTGNTLGSTTFTVTGIGGTTSPNFSAVGLVANQDRVVIRHNDGTFAEYLITGFAGNALQISPGLLAAANGLGAAMSIKPNVQIVPSSAGDVIQSKTQVYLLGLYVKPFDNTVSKGLVIFPHSNTILDNVFIDGGLNSITTSEDLADFNSTYAGVATGTNRNFGSTIFGQNSASSTILLRGILCEMIFYNSLVASRPAGATTVNAISALGASAIALINGISIGRVSAASEALLFLIFGRFDVTVHNERGIVLASKSRFGTNFGAGSIRIRSASGSVGATRGVDVQGGSVSLQASTLSFDSVNPAATVINLGRTPFIAASTATLGLGTINMPNSTLQIASAQNGSNLVIDTITGPVTVGATTQGFQIFDNSIFTYTGGSITPTTPSTGTLFDIRGDSRLVIPAGATRTFNNFGTIFNFDNNSSGDIFNSNATANAGGINVQARNMSRVLLDTVTLSGANTGIFTESGAYVGQVGLGTPITNTSTTPFTPVVAKVSTATTIPNYTNVSYSSGTIVYNP